MINFVVVDDNTSHRKRIVSTIVSKMMSNQIDFNINEFNDYSNRLLKTIKDENTIYYNLINQTKYSNLEYYTLTKNNSNNKIDITFNNYLTLTNKKTKLPSDYYDIVVDPGHGGKDVGANKNGYYESKINLEYVFYR